MKDRSLLLPGLCAFLCFGLGALVSSVITSRVYSTVIQDMGAAHAVAIASLEAQVAAGEDRNIALLESMSYEGKASHYGHIEQGWPTANGETFNRHAMTAALVWPLPLNRWYHVRRLDTGASVRVWANDRLPSKWKRLIDLSDAAAIHVDMIGPGTAPVQIVPIFNTR